MSHLTTQSQPQMTARPGMVPAAPSSGGGAGLTPKDLLRILLRRRWLIIISIALLTGLAVVGTYVWQSKWPWFRAMALVEVQPPQASALDRVRASYNEAGMERLMMTHSAIISGDSVLSQASEDPNLKRTKWYQRLPKDRVVQELKEQISVGPVPDSSLLRISMTGVDKGSLPTVVNAVARAAVEHGRTWMTSGKEVEIERMNIEHRELSDNLDRIREQITDKRKSIAIGNFQDRFNTLTIQLQDIVPRRTQLRIERDRARQELTTLERQLQSGQLQSAPEVVEAINRDPTLHQLRATKINLETQLDNLLRKYGPDHRRVKDTETLLETVQSQISAAEQSVVQSQTQGLLQIKRQQLEAIVHELNQVGETYEQINDELKGVQSALAQVDEMRANAEKIERQIQRLEEQMLDLRLLARNEAPLVLAQRANPPEEPYMPKWPIMIALGLFLGLSVGVGLAMLLELADSSIRNPADVGRRIDLPLLGMVPHLDDLEDDIDDLQLASLQQPGSMLGEAFRQVRTNLLFSGPAEQRRSLLVTSASPEDGRTTITMNLAATMARGGRRVLVVDTNFRQPAIGAIFPDCPEGGLSSALTGQANWREMTLDVGPNLTVMASGPQPPSPADLLTSDAMKTMIAEATEEYDQVLFDGPPCMVVADPTVMSSLVDGVVLVIRANANTHGIVQRSRDSLHRVGARIIGAVLNGVRATSGGYLRKNYEAFYDYHEPAELPHGRKSAAPVKTKDS